MLTVLITGATGYLGQKVLEQLAQDLAQGQIKGLIALDLRPVPVEKRLPQVEYLELDIRDPLLGDWMEEKQVDVVIHLAAVLDSASISREMQYEIDVLGTRNLLEGCLRAGTWRLIVSSSGAAYGYHADNPAWLSEDDPLRGNEIFAYSDHKRQVEEMLADYRQRYPHLEQTIFRFCTILGKETRNLITRLFERKSILGIKGQESPFVFIWDEDAARLLRQSVYSSATGVFNAAGDGALRTRDIALLLGKPYRELSPRLLRLALRLLRSLRLSQYGPEQVLFLQYRPVLDNHRLKTVFGFQPQKNSLEAFCYYAEQQGLLKASPDEVRLLHAQ